MLESARKRYKSPRRKSKDRQRQSSDNYAEKLIEFVVKSISSGCTIRWLSHCKKLTLSGCLLSCTLAATAAYTCGHRRGGGRKCRAPVARPVYRGCGQVSRPDSEGGNQR